MVKTRKKRSLTTEANGKSKKVRNEVNVSSDDNTPVEDEVNDSEPDSYTDTTHNNCLAKIVGDDNDDDSSETDSDLDSDDEALVNVAKPSKTFTTKSTARNEKCSYSKPVVTDELIKEKELEIEAIIAHRQRENGNKNYCFKWKDTTKGVTWESRCTALLYYPNHLRKYEAEAKKADEVDAILAYKENFGEPRYLLKWKDTARGDTWTSRQKTVSLCPDILRKFVADEKKANEVEAIVSHQKYHGCNRYLVKWKDQSKGETWESEKRVKKFGRQFLTRYKEQQKEAKLNKPKEEVEAIVSHKKNHGRCSYLVKWKDHSKGETWVSENKLLGICPQSVTDYDEEMKKAVQLANEVEAIGDHKKVHGYSKFLIQWKDHSKGETWETARKTMALAQNVLGEFVEKNPDCNPVRKRGRYRSSDRSSRERKGKRKVRATQRQSRTIPDRWEDSDTDQESHYIKVKDVAGMSYDEDEDDDDDESHSEENVEWEVEQIVGVKIMKGKSREFLIRWKGYGAKHDSWEAEEQLNCPDLIKKFNLSQTERRPHQSKQIDRRALKPKTSTSRHSNRSAKKQK